MFQKILFWIFVLKIAAALPGVYVDKGNVGASWGGYSASAGLGGLLGGAGPRGGLHAQAGTPDGHFASAGLGGSVSEGAGPQGQLYSTAGQAQPGAVANAGSSSQASASASASSSTNSFGGGVQGGAVPTVVNKRPGSFFDDIFNIPISTLGAVNQYLNNRNKVATVPSGVVRVQPVVQVPQSNLNTFASSSASSSSASSASSSSSASATSSADAGTPSGIDNNIYHGYYKTSPNYNDIFNIPISVLGAVNRFLNGK